MNTTPLLYRNAMIEVKQRFRAIDRILGAKKPRTLDAGTDNEFMWLQVRKIIELVVFGGIMADEARYAALRAETSNNPDYTQDWKVSSILPKLARITPHFLPIPLGTVIESEDGTKHFRQGKVLQTKDRFLQIYNAAGMHLHVPNPFGFETLAEFHDRRQASRSALEVELTYLKGVLWEHAKIGLMFEPATDKPQDNGDPTNAWLTYFGHADVDDVQLIQATADPVRLEAE